MARLRLNNVGDATGATNPITISSATTGSCSWTSAPANLPASGVSLPDYVALVVEPNTSSEEIVWLVGWTPGATTGSILRNPPGEANPGTPATHTSKPWVHGPTQMDFKSPSSRHFANTQWR